MSLSKNNSGKRAIRKGESTASNSRRSSVDLTVAPAHDASSSSAALVETGKRKRSAVTPIDSGVDSSVDAVVVPAHDASSSSTAAATPQQRMIQINQLGANDIQKTRPAAYARIGPLVRYMDGANRSTEQSQKLIGIVRRAMMNRIGTACENPNLPPNAALQFVDVHLLDPVFAFFDARNEETQPNTRRPQNKVALDAQLQEAKRFLFPSGNAPETYRAPYVEPDVIRLTTEAIFVAGTGQYGDQPTELELAASYYKLRYRSVRPDAPLVPVKDLQNADVNDLAIGDMVMVEFIHRPYNFETKLGYTQCGHKLKIVRILRIKRRIVDCICKNVQTQNCSSFTELMVD